MTYKTALLCLICWSLAACLSTLDYTKSYEMTVKVVDKAGNPVKNREVRLYINNQFFRQDSIIKFAPPKITAMTNNFGNVTLNYDLKATEIASDNAHILVKEDADFIAINAISYQIPGNLKKGKELIKLSATIQMDSLVPFKIQIKSNKTNVNVLSLDLYTDESTRDSDLNYRFRRSFISILKNRTPAILDTTITVNVYSRTQFLMGNYIKLSDGKQIFGNHIIDSTDVRKVLFVNEIN